MKLGFKRGDHWYSTLTRMFTTSQWSHGAVAIERPEGWRLYESSATKGVHHKSGVRDYPLLPDVADDYHWFDLGTAGDQDALNRYELVKNHGYDFFSLLSFLPIFNVRDSSRLYCWELVLWMVGGYAKWRVTPEIILTFILKRQA